jgi:hypothetical protein
VDTYVGAGQSTGTACFALERDVASMMNYNRFAGFVFLAAGALGCAATAPYRYSPPEHELIGRPEPSVSVGASYDETWSRLIDMLSQSFLSIEILDKASGFIRLGFADSEPSSLIDCGMMLRGDHSAEPYASNLAQREDLAVRGRVNVFVKPIDTRETFVRVHSQYGFGPYSFETGEISVRRDVLIGISAVDVSCMPTGRAERIVLGAAKGE